MIDAARDWKDPETINDRSRDDGRRDDRRGDDRQT